MKATAQSSSQTMPSGPSQDGMELPSLPVRVLFSGRARSSAVTRYAMARIHCALRRFHNRIANVLVRIHDVNGKRGGCDQQCSMEVQLINGQRLYLSDLAETPKRGIARLLHRTRRLLQERREHRRR